MPNRCLGGIARIGAFHEHIGCTPCAAFYESEVYLGLAEDSHVGNYTFLFDHFLWLPSLFLPMDIGKAGSIVANMRESSAEPQVRRGPWVAAPHARAVKSIGFSRNNATCQLYDVDITMQPPFGPAAQFWTGPGTGPHQRTLDVR